MKALYLKLLKIFGVTLAVLLFVEVLLRIFWHPPFLDPRYKRNDFDWLSKNVVLNNFGYWEKEVKIEKNKDTIRIYILGDSYTYGWYLEKGQSFPEVMKEYLVKQYGFSNVEIINAARPGFNFETELTRLNDEGLAFNPDLVLIGINAQDFVFKEFPPKYVKSKLVRSLRIYWLTHGMIEKVKSGNKTMSEVKKAYTLGSGEYDRTKQLLEMFSNSVKKINATPVLVVFPQYDALNPNRNYQFSFFHETISTLASNNNIKVIDLYEKFKGVEDKKLLVLNPNDQHPSFYANKLAGEYVSDTLMERKLLNPKEPAIELSSMVLAEDSNLERYSAITRLPLSWAYFDIKNGLATQKIFLYDNMNRQTSFLEDTLKSAYAGKHQGWPGAKIEYNAIVDDKRIEIPLTLYGFQVLGISNLQVFWRVDGSQRSETVDLQDVQIIKDGSKIFVIGIDNENLDFARVTVDVAVAQFNLENGKVSGFYHSKMTNLTEAEKCLSKAQYFWLNNVQENSSNVSYYPRAEIPVLCSGLGENKYPEIQYLR